MKQVLNSCNVPAQSSNTISRICVGCGHFQIFCERKGVSLGPPPTQHRSWDEKYPSTSTEAIEKPIDTGLVCIRRLNHSQQSHNHQTIESDGDSPPDAQGSCASENSITLSKACSTKHTKLTVIVLLKPCDVTWLVCIRGHTHSQRSHHDQTLASDGARPSGTLCERSVCSGLRTHVLSVQIQMQQAHSY